jgi:hypothetical protein
VYYDQINAVIAEAVESIRRGLSVEEAIVRAAKVIEADAVARHAITHRIIRDIVTGSPELPQARTLPAEEVLRRLGFDEPKKKQRDWFEPSGGALLFRKLRQLGDIHRNPLRLIFGRKQTMSKQRSQSGVADRSSP